MPDRQKKPKPMGNGNYTICRKCHGFGTIVETKHYRGKVLANKNNEVDLFIRCPKCLGGGWTVAK
ncbi:hypothetical protein SEA_ANNADREAMY_175 [Streptomyces phage Annadreamy]|uniref:Uncharacterized protein n=2 Tax=Annadreamyvirus annadreamy TaxID=2846392 RepID=A0A345GTJ0_9CAUD|nr:hypothetical protein HWB75_gp101 [Streptomyces phage Annadreamy]AXG66262.1 hypothetical protein SEA_ANNADREAMY_175 [Streptomyces phage Annadreamy]QGH79485.1 hypothetical protein SEA_LIMPID_182 [Streptomyces phage Limpid]